MMPDTVPYCGPAPVPAEFWASWNFDPLLLTGLLGLAVAFGFHVRRQPEPQKARSSALFIAGWLLLAVVFVSPVCALSSALFSARVAHHTVLVAFAAPLIALAWTSHPAGEMSQGLRLGIATLLQTIAVWVWHAPAPYAAAMAHHGLFWLMELSLLGTALFFWRAVFACRSPGGVALALLGTTVQMGFLGALITFARTPLYEPHLATTLPWGLTPLEDQQLAGLIMWVPPAIPYIAVALLQVSRWLDGMETRTASNG
ncbi:cytochrome c oxidase assembly protein [Microvirga pudoricolor]|uniref:cytochrome c oxidase assembly protein n=1 Tax=Microvirga pudoricolor TaxID=2778729 RepID=UPI0019506264|nr:cytochrome c oxidase assembly protein [Microvirga pudoricolor]MBM6594949.1 cytochrome c oxidase assembly protein [Microvirga pudoricolor]